MYILYTYIYIIHLSWELEIEWCCSHSRSQDKQLHLGISPWIYPLGIWGLVVTWGMSPPCSHQRRLGWSNDVIPPTKPPKAIGDLRGFRWERDLFSHIFLLSSIQMNSACWNIRSLSKMILMVYNYTPVIKHSNGKSPFSIGNTSSKGSFSIAMLDYQRVGNWDRNPGDHNPPLELLLLPIFQLQSPCDRPVGRFIREVISHLEVAYFGCGPLPVTVTTRVITNSVGNPYKPSFATVTGRGPHPRHIITMGREMYTLFTPPQFCNWPKFNWPWKSRKCSWSNV